MAKSQVIGSQSPHRIKSRTTRLKSGSVCTSKQSTGLPAGVSLTEYRWIEIVALHVFEQARTNASGDESTTAGCGHVPGRSDQTFGLLIITRA
jgi:hypothetical protein